MHKVRQMLKPGWLIINKYFLRMQLHIWYIYDIQEVPMNTVTPAPNGSATAGGPRGLVPLQQGA